MYDRSALLTDVDPHVLMAEDPVVGYTGEVCPQGEAEELQITQPPWTGLYCSVLVWFDMNWSVLNRTRAQWCYRAADIVHWWWGGGTSSEGKGVLREGRQQLIGRKFQPLAERNAGLALH